MTKTTSPSLMTGSPAPTRRVGNGADSPMTEQSAAELRDLCAAKGEPFDSALTEAQARARIVALKDQT